MNMLTMKAHDHNPIVTSIPPKTRDNTNNDTMNANNILGRKAIPPRRGIIMRCTLRVSGKSYNLRFLQNFIITGIKTAPEIRLMMKAKIT